MITHAFFELPGVLADPVRLRAEYPAHLGVLMASRYGGTQDIWTDAYVQVRDDWDSYWSDLNLKGDEPLAAMWEGLFRTARALFRLAEVPEPEKADLIPFSRALPGLALERFDALYPQARTLLENLRTDGICLHVASHWTAAMARGLLAGGSAAAYFSEPIFGMDVTEMFDKDYAYLALKVGASPECCLVVDSDTDSLKRAGAAGMYTALVRNGNDLANVLALSSNNRLLQKGSSGGMPLL